MISMPCMHCAGQLVIPSMEDESVYKVSVLLFWTLSLEMNLPFLHTDLPNTIYGCIECLICHHGISHSTIPDQEAHFIAGEVGQWACGHEIHWSYHVPYHFEVADLIEWWNGL